jgi:hypothetical protein
MPKFGVRVWTSLDLNLAQTLLMPTARLEQVHLIVHVQQALGGTFSAGVTWGRSTLWLFKGGRSSTRDFAGIQTGMK